MPETSKAAISNVYLRTNKYQMGNIIKNSLSGTHSVTLPYKIRVVNETLESIA